MDKLRGDERRRELPFEPDERFPSGPWTGFFLQPPLRGRHWMELRLTFCNGRIRGDGRDRIGPFTFTGTYDVRDGTCHWTKRYVGQHDVAYRGYNEGRGIWGVWDIPPHSRGGFHIWPVGMADPTGQEQSEEVEEVVAIGRELAVPAGRVGGGRIKGLGGGPLFEAEGVDLHVPVHEACQLRVAPNGPVAAALLVGA